MPIESAMLQRHPRSTLSVVLEPDLDLARALRSGTGSRRGTPRRSGLQFHQNRHANAVATATRMSTCNTGATPAMGSAYLSARSTPNVIARRSHPGRRERRRVVPGWRNEVVTMIRRSECPVVRTLGRTRRREAPLPGSRPRSSCAAESRTTPSRQSNSDSRPRRRRRRPASGQHRAAIAHTCAHRETATDARSWRPAIPTAAGVQ